jgi:hypothetical protein
LCTDALADEAIGKVVWVDQKNSILLIECTATGCAKIPSAKEGETYSFAIPAKLKDAAAGLKEGEQITLQYEQAKEGYQLLALTK